MTEISERFKFMLELVDYFQKLNIEKGDIFVVSLNADVSDHVCKNIKQIVEEQLAECFTFKVPVFIAVGGMLDFKAFKIRAKDSKKIEPNKFLLKG